MPDFLFDTDGAVAWLTLNRPESMNAMSNEMMRELADALDRCAEDDEVRAVVLTGAGERAFCAGGDVKGMASRNNGGSSGGSTVTLEDRIHSLHDSMRRTSLRIHTLPKPTIAAINGYAMGAGLSLALSCDLRVMADTAQLGTAFAGVALAGDYGGTWFMTRLVGSAKARELYFLNDRVKADEALQAGLVNRVVPAADLRNEAQALAARLASGPTKTLSMMKENLVLAEHADLETLLEQEAKYQIVSGTTEDHREAAKAFVEKRKPNFVGR
ncbi:MAG: enoyl-CoA hydratase [Actinobacteria bacterium]|nr:enoyl-CoA hydratase [Actinomycetota bacterium]